ncbi:hypothetical protein B0H14DRAFT_2642704 [Mycena olivaceomarginata]|nr:hypothetical protein B0H14DRAFT_2642704 [Mycena olivaceomarginata]
MSLDSAKSTTTARCDDVPVLCDTDTGAGEGISDEDPEDEFDVCRIGLFPVVLLGEQLVFVLIRAGLTDSAEEHGDMPHRCCKFPPTLYDLRAKWCYWTSYPKPFTWTGSSLYTPNKSRNISISAISADFRGSTGICKIFNPHGMPAIAGERYDAQDLSKGFNMQLSNIMVFVQHKKMQFYSTDKVSSWNTCKGIAHGNETGGTRYVYAQGIMLLED